MRILIVSGTWEPQANGVARVATAVGEQLATRGHEVTALVPTTPGLPAEHRDGSLVVERAIPRGWIPLTVGDVLQTRRLTRGRSGFDVLLAHGVMGAVGLAHAGLAAPLALVYHASLARELRFMRPRLPWGRGRLVAYVNQPIAKVLELEAVRRAGRILVLSEFSTSLVAQDHPGAAGKLRLVSGGVDADAFEPADGRRSARDRLGVDQDRPLLVTVRRAEPRMGLENLVHALALLDRDDVSLAVVGGGMLDDELRRLGRDLGLDGRLRFAGHVPEAELHDWYRAANLFVLPTVAYEGFGMVTLEALATGTPVVGTPVGATPELLEPLEPRLVANGVDPPALAEAVSRALAFSDDALGARCREYAVTRFAWGVVVDAWESALLDAAEGRA